MHTYIVEMLSRFLIASKYDRGDWFEFVSSPHYSAEILIYFALALVGDCRREVAYA